MSACQEMRGKMPVFFEKDSDRPAALNRLRPANRPHRACTGQRRRPAAPLSCRRPSARPDPRPRKQGRISRSISIGPQTGLDGRTCQNGRRRHTHAVFLFARGPFMLVRVCAARSDPIQQASSARPPWRCAPPRFDCRRPAAPLCARLDRNDVSACAVKRLNGESMWPIHAFVCCRGGRREARIRIAALHRSVVLPFAIRKSEKNVLHVAAA